MPLIETTAIATHVLNLAKLENGVEHRFVINQENDHVMTLTGQQFIDVMNAVAMVGPEKICQLAGEEFQATHKMMPQKSEARQTPSQRNMMSDPLYDPEYREGMSGADFNIPGKTNE